MIAKLSDLAEVLRDRDIVLRIAPTSDKRWSAQFSARGDAWNVVASTADNIDDAVDAALKAWIER